VGEAEAAPQPIALWHSDRPAKEFIGGKSPWLENQTGLAAFLLPAEGQVYAYDPKTPVDSQRPVAETWVEFATARGLPTTVPPIGTKIISPVVPISA